MVKDKQGLILGILVINTVMLLWLSFKLFCPMAMSKNCPLGSKKPGQCLINGAHSSVGEIKDVENVEALKVK